jgi:hypothetical protein
MALLYLSKTKAGERRPLIPNETWLQQRDDQQRYDDEDLYHGADRRSGTIIS